MVAVAQSSMLHFSLEIVMIRHQLHDDLSPVTDIFRFDDSTTGRAVDAISENVALEKLVQDTRQR